MIRLALAGGEAVFTERAEGNLSTSRGDRHAQGAGARSQLCEELGLQRLCAGAQVHGSTVRRITTADGSGNGAATAKADGQITTLSLVGAMVLTADCLPVMLGCASGAVAALHAGWRGLAGGVLEEGVRTMRELTAVEHAAARTRQPNGAAEIVAIIGPGAGPCCYEVGPEVHAAFGRTPPGDPVGAPAKRGTPIDLKAIARERLLAVGVDSVEDVGLCTICDERFFSYRREGDRAGRQAGIAWLS